jgi:predicted ATPase
LDELIKYNLPGFIIKELLSEDKSYLVFRGFVDDDNKNIVRLKVPKKNEHETCNRNEIEHEYNLLANLVSPSVSQAMFYVDNDKIKVLVLEDHTSIPIYTYLGKIKGNISEIFPILIEIVHALSYIHNARIIHNSIQPSNIHIDEKTGKIKISDFQNASRVPYTNKHFIFHGLEDKSAVYISPEQTGMMNRSVDYRTDYYSLGIVFYEMLTGRLPFGYDNPIEIAHAHIAEKPESLHYINPDIPLALSDIVLKLLEKKAEDRYQSCSGIINDLEMCANIIAKNDRNTTFVLGEKDIGNLFYIPEKLYGRDSEMEKMMQAYEKENIAGAKPILLFISGTPGIGKSSLIQEFRSCLIGRKVFFISGKYDQFRRSAPYSAVISAFRNLVDLMLADRDTLPEAWGSMIKQTLGSNTGVVTDVIPCLERVTGPISPPLSLSPSETEIRFSYVFQNFLQLFAKNERPLVFVLEDLQWVDESSVHWLEIVLKNPELTNFLFIGSFRKDEIDDDHTLYHLFSSIDEQGFKRIDIELGQLSPENIDQLLSETLHTKREETKSLAEMVNSRTAGNPFFVNEFVKSLSLGRLYGSLVTDNVVDFVAGKILALPKETQDLLRVASCAGILIFFDTLSLVCNKNTDKLIDILKPAIDEGLVLKLESGAMFGHDRVREAVYRMLDEEEKIENHYRLGKALLDITNDSQIEDRIFPIVHQLNIARKKIQEPDQRIQLARLNFIAGFKSKNSTAYEPALKFFRIACELLPANSWTSQFELTLSLVIETCEVEYLTGNYKKAEESFNDVIRNARDNLDIVRVYKAQIPLNTAIGKANYAMEQGRKACSLLKIRIPSKVTQFHVMIELAKALFRLKKRDINSLVDLPDITDQRSLVVSELLMNMTLPAYISFPDSVPYLMIKLFNSSLQKGNSPYSAYAYASFSLILVCVLGNIESGFALGKFAFELGKKNEMKIVRCKASFIFGNLINHWKKPLHEDIPILEEGAVAGLESGDITFASFCVNHNMAHSIFCGENLSKAKDKGERLLKTMKRFKQIDSIYAFYLFYQCIINLQETDKWTSFSINGEYFHEESITGEWIRAGNQTDLGFYHVIRQFLSYLAGDYETCIQFSIEGKKYLGNMLGMLYVKESYYYHALAMLAVSAHAEKSKKKEYKARIGKNLEMVRKWALSCPENCRHKYLFVKAEFAAVYDTAANITALFDEAIEAAHKNCFINEEALICERAADYCYNSSNYVAGDKYLQQAYDSYRLWGAKAKCMILKQRHPGISEAIR